MTKIVLCGGSGQVGQTLARSFVADGHEVVVLARQQHDGVGRFVHWDGKTMGEWMHELDGADAVINLAGRSVNCRYTEDNLQQMLDSRVESTRVVGVAIPFCQSPPPVWLQMSTATIYAHSHDVANDEKRGVIGGREDDVPAYWAKSVEIALAWERELRGARTPDTRKVALRTAMVMSPDAGGIFDVLLGLVRKRLGGKLAGGRQFISWIHHRDFVRAVKFVIDRPAIEDAINFAAPLPVTQAEFMGELRKACGIKLGLPATRWMLEIGAFFMRTDTELVLKSRRVVPGRLLEAGFEFEFPTWPEAAVDLVASSKA